MKTKLPPNTDLDTKSTESVQDTQDATIDLHMDVVSTEVVFERNKFKIFKEILVPRRHPDKRLVGITGIMRDAVFVLPITPDKKVVLVEQFRYGTKQVSLEVPGGGLEDHEHRDTTAAALRELQEETGFTSHKILSIPTVNPMPSVYPNTNHLFVALACQPLDNKVLTADEYEEIIVRTYTIEETVNLVRLGVIKHPVSAYLILYYHAFLMK
jgi:8-oxo-dGTP pyrophosphatase MutT (NUDIX family)